MGRRTNRSPFFLAACCLASLFVSCKSSQMVVGERPDQVLQQNLETLVKGFKGDVGLYVRHLGTGQTAAIQADTLFPTASMASAPKR